MSTNSRAVVLCCLMAALLIAGPTGAVFLPPESTPAGHTDYINNYVRIAGFEITGLEALYPWEQESGVKLAVTWKRHDGNITWNDYMMTNAAGNGKWQLPDLIQP